MSLTIVLKREIVGAQIRRNRPPARRQELRQLEELTPEAQSHDPGTCPEHSGQQLVLTAGELTIERLLEGQHGRVEVDRAVHVGHGHADTLDRYRGGRRRHRAAHASRQW